MRSRCEGYVILAALLFVPAPTAAQELLVGAQLGIGWSTFDTGEGLDGHRTGVFGGMTASYALNRLLRVESGARWVEKGAEGELQGFEEPISTEQRLSYLQIPLVLRFSWFPGSAVRPSVLFGPAVSFETRCRMSRDVGVLASVVRCDDQERTGTDVAALFGGGLAWRFGRAELLLEGLYDLGLRDVSAIDAVRVRNRGFVLAPRLSISLGRADR
jgi:hypothetical protein